MFFSDLSEIIFLKKEKQTIHHTWYWQCAVVVCLGTMLGTWELCYIVLYL